MDTKKVQVIAVIAEKGGVGKSTLTLSLAVSAVLAGRKVAVLDTDPQSTSSKWTDRRSNEMPWVVPTHAARLAAAIEQAQAQGVDLVVIDTPPHAANEMADAVRLADFVLVPMEPHINSLETLPKLADLLKLAGGTEVTSFVINKAPTQGPEAKQAAEYIAEQGFVVCPVVVHTRAAVRHAGNVGEAVPEYEPDGKAALEALQLYEYTLLQLDTRSRAHG